jgi:hypothetical protein
MKYIITEDQKGRVFQKIYEFINNLIPKDRIITYYYAGFVSDSTNYDSLDVADENGNTILRVYLKDYFYEKTSMYNSNILLSSKLKTPILSVEYYYVNILNNLFGTHWSEVMIKWFEDNFPQLHHIKIKTVE